MARRGAVPAVALAVVLAVGAAGTQARAASGVTAQTAGGSTLDSGGTLTSGQSLTSDNGEYELIMQGDGNLVEYMAGRPLWDSGTQGNPGAWAVMQGDGNLVVYSSGGQALWDSATQGNPGADLVLQNDANLVVYSGSTAKWVDGAVNNELTQGQQLAQGQSLQSPDRHYELIMQGDGNLVEYVSGGRALWDSGTQGNPGAWAVMQGDGNLVVYSSGGQALWDSATQGNAGAYLALQNDANLVAYSGSTAKWVNGGVNDEMDTGDKLTAGQSLQSSDRRYELIMQGDGNLVEYLANGQALWTSGTQGNPGAWAVMQGDGNLVVYSSSGQALWSSGTQGHSGAHALLQNDANFVVYGGTTALWANYAGGAGGQPITLGSWPGTSGPGAAAQQYGYPYSDPPACTDGGACVPDKWSFYQGQCVSWVAYRLNELNGIAFSNFYGGNGRWSDASNWGPHAQALGITVNGTPAVGSVAWYSFGHVAYVEQVNSPTSVVISEMNYDNDNGFRVRTITTSSGWPTGFIHIADR